MANQTNVNSIYMESVVQVQSIQQTTWYDYENSFSDLMIDPQDPQIIFEQEVSPHDQPQKTKGIHKTTKRSPAADRNYYCTECGASFSNSSNLKSHRRIHSGERPYACDVCGASFVQSSNMKAHKRIHTGERPFTCTECGQTFSRSSHLTGHKRTHTGERPYICGVCHRSFVTSSHLRNHMRKHTGEKPFACRICKSTFAHNGSLEIHLRIHTGERPFKCNNCTSTFRSKADLRSHYKLHTELKPHLCIQCDKTFKTRQYLHKHVKTCGAPPTGKKRGRPRKTSATSTEGLSSKGGSSSIALVGCVTRVKKPRPRVKTHVVPKEFKFGSQSDANELESNEQSLATLKKEIPFQDVHQQIELESIKDEDQAVFLASAKHEISVNPTGDIDHLNTFSCNSEINSCLNSQQETNIYNIR